MQNQCSCRREQTSWDVVDGAPLATERKHGGRGRRAARRRREEEGTEDNDAEAEEEEDAGVDSAASRTTVYTDTNVRGLLAHTQAQEV